MSATAPHRAFAAVWFDCDSTLSAIEGIDELGALRDAATRRRVADLTERAMAGELPLAEVYEQRLQALAPTAAECASLGALYVARALPDARVLVAALHALGKTVGVLSGGLRPPVAEFAAWLGIGPALVQAVGIHFAADGSYRDFDRSGPLWRNGGKVEVLRDRPAGERPLAFVGDGITDLEAAPVVERFVGFGGVARRAAVERNAAFYTAEPRLAAVLPHLLTAAEREQLAADPRFAHLVG
jgi:phosphoserine phosphatase